MINSECLQDMANMGIELCGTIEPKYNNRVIDMFSKYGIDDVDDRVQINKLLENQNRFNPVINIVKDLIEIEVIYNYLKWEIRKIASIQVMGSPVSCTFYLDLNDENITIKSENIIAKTFFCKSTNDLFNTMQKDAIALLYSEIEQPIEVPINEITDFLLETKYKKIIYDSEKIFTEGFNTRTSISAIIKSHISTKNTSKKIIGVKGCLPNNEILLKKNNSNLDTGLIISPYTITCGDDSKWVGRYGLAVTPNINDIFQRVKLIF